ncbi:uncharacterized protein C12orf40 homolog [Spea bombifrons]|uniref:uncharacterized protein C12orf40 homolog n=1 Tax=Spea bombifrons TaxID=233779 RepID=UPI0023495B4B|nr:uncharacterized protein C12orf40 homolog [Spea bombifrons]
MVVAASSYSRRIRQAMKIAHCNNSSCFMGKTTLQEIADRKINSVEQVSRYTNINIAREVYCSLMWTNDKLPVSAVSVSYSPWTFDSYVSESSEMQSEDEDAADTESENISRSEIMPGYQNEIYTKHMPDENIQTSQKYDVNVKDIKANHSSLYCDASYMCDTIKETKLNICARQDAWCQTDKTSYVAEACHVAVQCDILQKCKCAE